MNRNIIIMCILLMTFSIFSYSQTVTTKAPLTPEEYMTKSRNQKKTAWILLGTGIVAMGAGLDVMIQDNEINDETFVIGSILFLTGGIMDVLCIPFFISAGSNKRKGMEATTQIMLQPTSPELRNVSISPVMPGAAVTFTF